MADVVERGAEAKTRKSAATLATANGPHSWNALQRGFDASDCEE